MALAVSAKDEVGESQPIESDFRKQIPAEGLREYWYPAVLAKKLGRRRPVGVRLLGENLVFFRDRAGKIVALQDLCAHRGSKLSRGVCHFPGTITCPYHGWTYDAEGKCVAALVEGPESRIPQSGVEVPVKQVKELCGIAWVWMGDGDPVPLEEDVPEEFLDPNVHVLTEVQLWPINWRPLIENAIDGHAPYVHRNSLLAIFSGLIAGYGIRVLQPVQPRTSLPHYTSSHDRDRLWSQESDRHHATIWTRDEHTGPVRQQSFRPDRGRRPGFHLVDEHQQAFSYLPFLSGQLGTSILEVPQLESVCENQIRLAGFHPLHL